MPATRDQILERLMVEIGADATSLIDALTDVRRKTEETLTDTEKRIKAQEEFWRKTRAEAQQYGKMLGGFVRAQIFAATKALADQARQAIKSAEAFEKMSQRTGVSAEQLSTLVHAANLAGASAEVLEKSLGEMAKRFNETGTAAERTDQFLSAVGLSLEQLQGQTPDQQLLTLADAFSQLEDGAEKSKVAGQLLGEEFGKRMIPFLNQGRAGIEALQQEARALGLEVSTNFARDAAVYEDLMTKLDARSSEFAKTLATAVLPDLNDVIGAFVEGAKQGGLMAGVIESAGAAWEKFSTLGQKALLAVELKAIDMAATFIKSLGLERVFEANLAGMRLRVEQIAKEHKGMLAEQAAREEEAAQAAVVTAKKRAIDLAKVQGEAGLGRLAEQEQKAKEALEARLQTAEKLTQVEALQRSFQDGAFKDFSDKSKAELLVLAEKLDLIERTAKANEQQRSEEKAIQELKNQLEVLRAISDEQRTQIEIRQSSAEILDPIRKAEFESLSLQIAQEKALAEAAKSKADEQKKAAEKQADLIAQVLERGKTVAEKRAEEIAQIRELAMVNEEIRARESELIAGIEKRYDELSKRGQGASKQIANEGEVAAKSLQDNFASLLFDPFEKGLDGMLSNFVSTMRKMASQQVAQRLIGGLFGGAGGGGGGSRAPGFASGGMVLGPGTETSDSITARLSRNEFVQPARAVHYYGAEFMEALRRLRVPKMESHRFTPSVPRIPRYADGGLVADPATAAPAANFEVAIANVSSEQEALRLLGSRRGREIIFNHIGADGGHQVSKILGSR